MTLKLKALLFTFLTATTVVFSADGPEDPTKSQISYTFSKRSAFSTQSADVDLSPEASASGLVAKNGVLTYGELIYRHGEMVFVPNNEPVYLQWSFDKKVWHQGPYSKLLKVPSIFIGPDMNGIAQHALFMSLGDVGMRLGKLT